MLEALHCLLPLYLAGFSVRYIVSEVSAVCRNTYSSYCHSTWDSHCITKEAREQAALLGEEEYLIWNRLGNKSVFEGQRLTGVTLC